MSIAPNERGQMDVTEWLGLSDEQRRFREREKLPPTYRERNLPGEHWFRTEKSK